MKIIYVGDNRNRGNFGCRGTSTALSMLIEQKHTITATISGFGTDQNIGYLFYYNFLPAWCYRFVNTHGFRKELIHFFAHLFNKKRDDFVSSDFDKSISNFKKCLIANPALEELNLDNYDFDAMIVNGEGSFIFSTPAWREPLVLAMLMHWAQLKGKRVYLMNAMFSDSPFSERNNDSLLAVGDVLAKCECVSVRERFSEVYVSTHFPTINLRRKPDALFTWYKMINDAHIVNNLRYYIPHSLESNSLYNGFDFSTPYILVAGSSGKVWNRTESVPAYVNLVNELKKHYNGNIYLMKVCEGDDFLCDVGSQTGTRVIPMEIPLVAGAKILSRADAFVSGRYHPAIMASLGGTPCVFMSSNSHKTLSLQEVLGYDCIREYNDIPNTNDIQAIVADTLEKINEGKALREKIKSRCELLSKEAETISELI